MEENGDLRQMDAEGSVLVIRNFSAENSLTLKCLFNTTSEDLDSSFDTLLKGNVSKRGKRRMVSGTQLCERNSETDSNEGLGGECSCKAASHNGMLSFSRFLSGLCN